MTGIQGFSPYQLTGGLYALNTLNKNLIPSAFSGMTAPVTSQKPGMTQQMRQLIRDLEKTPQKEETAFIAVSEDKANGYMDLSEKKDEEENDQAVKPVNYNCREVETKIQRAKTVVSAGQAVLSAKRKVVEVKRKVSSGKCDPEEVQLALTHARRMEMVARKKKHNLELEEMVQVTRKRDERLEDRKESADSIRNAVITAQEEKVSEKEDDIFDKRQEMLSEAIEQMEENGAEISEESLADMNKMLSEFGEKELAQLEEAMEMLENMEVIDPHMSKEELEELKRKHRAAEQKAMVKADMDYLKGMVRHQVEKGGSAAGMNTGMTLGTSLPAGALGAVSSAAPQTAGIAVSSGGVSIDVQV